MVLVRNRDDGRTELCAPAVGYFRASPAIGAVITPGLTLGELEILGAIHHLVAPKAARGLVVESLGRELGRAPAEYGAALLVLDPGAVQNASPETTEAEAAEQEGLVFRAPGSGRFYRRSAPGRPAFVEVGDEIKEGQTVGLLEVMKTFNRLTYGGQSLPAGARVVRVVPEDGADLVKGDPILELEEP